MGGTGDSEERVTSCIGTSSNYPKECHNYFTEESAAFGNEGGYHFCKPKGGAFGVDWLPPPPWGKCDASTTRCKPLSPCISSLTSEQKMQCANIYDLNMDPRFYYEISYTTDVNNNTVAGHFKGHNNKVHDYTYQPDDMIGKIMGHLLTNLGIISIKLVNTDITDGGTKFDSTIDISFTASHDRDMRFWDESGDFYDAGTKVIGSDTQRSFSYASKHPRLEYVANKKFSV